MASSLLPPATFAKKYHTALNTHSAKHRQIRCGVVTDGGVAKLLSVLHLRQSSDPVVATVVSDSASDGWEGFLDELESALQAYTADPAASDAAVPDKLLSLPSVSDATNAISDEVLLSVVDPSSMVFGEVTSGGAALYAIPDELLGALHLDASSPAVRAASGVLSRLEELTAGMSDAERWALFAFMAVTWLYLTARPGVLSGTMDTAIRVLVEQYGFQLGYTY